MKIAVVFYLMLTSFFCLSQTQSEQFEKGVKLFNEKDYAGAVASFEQITSTKQSPELYYNLANAYIKNKQLAKAILNYERAIKLAPNNKKIKQNLSIAREQVDDDVIEIPDFLPVRVWNGFSQLLTPKYWIVLQAIFGLLSLLIVFLLLFKSVQKRRQYLLLLLLAIVGFSFALAASYSAHQNFQYNDKAILMESSNLMASPDERSELIKTINEGAKLKILDRIDPWVKVSLLNKEIGWILESDLERI